MTEYKKSWFFVKPYKNKLIKIIVSLLVVQVCLLASPLIIQTIIDDYILGIDNTWANVQEETEDTVNYNDKHYILKEELKDNQKAIGFSSILLLKDKHYFTTKEIPEGIRTFNNGNITVDNVDYPAKLLSDSQVEDFYSPLIKPMYILIVSLLVISIISLTFGYIQRMMGAMINAAIARDARYLAMDKLNYTPLDKVEAEPAGKLANRIINDATGNSQLILVTINVFLGAIISIAFSLIGMFYLDPSLALICLIIVPLIYGWTWFFTKKLNKIAVKINETNSMMIARINEIINGIGILKIFNTNNDTIDGFNTINKQFVSESMEETNLHLKSGWNGINLFQGLLGGLILIYFSYQQIQGNSLVDSGMVFAFYTFIYRMLSPLIGLFQQFGVIEHSKVKINRYHNIISTDEEDREITSIPLADGNIEFKNVNFSYDGKKNVLENINLSIKAKQKIGLVGHTGSGKSTMMNLLMRFSDTNGPENGIITMDGMDITSVTKRTYRQNIGIILQEPILFSNTLRNNILFGESMNDDKLIEIIRLVGADFLLKKFPNGLDEKISSKGGNLSLGEKQLISFARILVKNPSVIIMDEATANIDIETELLIQNALRVVSNDRTLIVIAHRLSTIVDSDQIVVLSEGKIIESGTHKKLIKDDFYYANMYRAQVE